MKKIRWALIGCGKVVLKNKTTPFINKSNTIVGICTTDINHSQLAKRKLRLKKCGCYDNVYDMIKNEKIDAIYICTPPKYHYEYLDIILQYKVPVYVEKPFVLNKNEAKEIVDKFKKNDILLFVAHYKRLTPKFQKLKLLIQQQIIGNIFYIEGIFNRVFNEELLQKTWIYNKNISGGGRFFDIAPHILDIIYYIFGNCSNFKSNVIFENEKHYCENKVIAQFKIKNIKCKLYFDLVADEDKDIITIVGDKGYIKTSINRDMPIYIYDNDNNLLKTYNFKKTKTWGIEAVREIDNIINNKILASEICTGNDAYKIQSYIDKILKK